MQQYNVHEAKSSLSKLLDAVTAGEEVVIAKNGKPVAKLVKIPSSEKRVLGLGRHDFNLPETGWQGPLSDEEADAFLEGR